MPKTKKTAQKPVKVTLEEAQDKRRNEVASTQSAGLYVAICDLLKERKGQVMTSTELGAAFGVPKSDTRHAMQRQGKLSSEGQPIAAHPTDSGIWIHLVKLSGNGRDRNGYVASKAGEVSPIK